MKAVTQAVRTLSEDQIQSFLDEDVLQVVVDGQTVALDRDDVEIVSEGIAGWLVGHEAGITVALDTELSETLISEGLARESINRIQNLRKTADFDVTDRIRIEYRASERLAQAMNVHAEWIRNETLALELHEAEQPTGVVQTFEIGSEMLVIGVQRSENGRAN